MSEHVVPLRRKDSAITGPDGLLDAVTEAIRAPDRILYRDGTVVYQFDVDLTAAEAALFDRIVTYVRSTPLLSPAEREALRPSLDTLRTFQQLTQAQWMALTANQRERQTFDVLTAQLRVLRALLRD